MFSERHVLKWNKGHSILRARHHTANLAICERNISWPRNNQEVKAYANASHPGDQASAQAGSRIWPFWPHGCGTGLRVKERRKQVMQLSSVAKESH